MTKKQSKVEDMSMPATLKAALGPPALLKFEDPRAYEVLMAEITASIQPADAIEWLLVKDVVDATWEIRRYRPFKAAVIDSEIESQLSSILRVPYVPESTTYETTEPFGLLSSLNTTVTHTISEEELSALRERRDNIIKEWRASPYLAEAGTRDYSTIYANAFMKGIENVNKIEALHQSAERRRNAALGKLEQYRTNRAASHRAASSKVIDGESQDLSAVNGPRILKKPV